MLARSEVAGLMANPTRVLLRCGGIWNLPNMQSNCSATLAVPIEDFADGFNNAAVAVQALGWEWSRRTMPGPFGVNVLDCPDGTDLVQPVCPRCALALARKA